MFREFPKVVVFLSLASFFNDIASDAIYPLLPLFLTQTIGASVLFVGLYEGIAESAASLTKVFVGYWSDRVGRRGPFVLAGYFLSNFVRPLTGLVTAPWQALAVRFADRLGKGTRTAPRDAWLGALAARGERGRIFGFHRAPVFCGSVWGHPPRSFLARKLPESLYCFWPFLSPTENESAGSVGQSGTRAQSRG